MSKNVEMEIAMMQEEMLLGEENLETSKTEEFEEVNLEKDKSHRERRKAGFKSKNKKMEIGQRKQNERKSKENAKGGITPSKNGTHYTQHETPDKKMSKKISQKKVRNTEEVGKGNAYKKLYDVNKK